MCIRDSYQAAGHAAYLSAIIDRGLDLQAAMEEPRSFATDGVLQVEATMPREVCDELARRGHRVTINDGPTGGAQAIRVAPGGGLLTGASDSRKDGAALGL